MTLDVEMVTAAIVSLLVMTSPYDPIKVVFFNQAIADPPRSRTASAGKVALIVAAIIGSTALLGRQVLDLLGIDLNAFRIVGGLIIAAMGSEMLYGGGSSGPQGEEHRREGPADDDTLVIPLSIPLIAGPGTIATTIAISSQGANQEGLVAALIAGGVVAVVAFVSFAVLGDAIAKIRPSAMALIARLGGLLLATIGVQMLLSGLKDFFA